MMSAYEYTQVAGYPFTPPSNSGISPEAKKINIKLRSVSDSAHTTVSLGSARHEARSRLSEAYQEACLDDWAGRGSLRVTERTLFNAIRFIDALPLNVPIPEINAEPDGHIAFEWRSAPYRVANISVGEGNKLPYAALLSDDKLYGSETFIDRLPRAVLETIKRVYSATQ